MEYLMKTENMLKEADLLLKKIKKSEEKSRFLESVDFELELVDELLKEIKSERIDEGFLDFLQKMVDGFATFLGAGLKELLGVNDERHSSSRDRAFKAAGKEVKKLKPDENPTDLVIWAATQDYVLEGMEDIKEGLNRVNQLPSPIPDPQNEDEAPKWEKGGEYQQISEEIASKGVAGAIALATAIGTKEPAIKEYKNIADSITAAAEDKETGGVLGALKGVVQFCESMESGSWVEAMKKAAELAPKMKWVTQNGIEIDAAPVINQATQIKSAVEGEISRLENAKKEIEENSGKENAEAGSGTEETEAPSTGAF